MINTPFFLVHPQILYGDLHTSSRKPEAAAIHILSRLLLRHRAVQYGFRDVGSAVYYRTE